MKKTFLLSLGACTAALSLFSCGPAPKAMPASQLNGPWNIVEVRGEPVAADRQPAPYIEFDYAQGRISGNSGCNRMMGSFQADTLQPGTLTFGPIASTRMACPDMSLERNILESLAEVRSFEAVCGPDKNDTLCKVALCSQEGEKLLLLEKKTVEATTDITALEGTWAIRTVGGEPVAESEKTPYLGFNLADKRIYGNPGCNTINGTFETDDQVPGALSFGQMISTLMMCPDMKTETAVLKALGEVKSFRISGEELLLCAASGQTVIGLEKDLTLGE